MKGRARTPEELGTRLEDAYALRDEKAVARLREGDALVARRRHPPAIAVIAAMYGGELVAV